MSRGLGKIQRDVLALIEGSTEDLNTFEIVRSVYGVKPDELPSGAQVVAVRRALRGLGRAGKVARVGHRYWTTLARGAEHELEIAAFKRAFGRG